MRRRSPIFTTPGHEGERLGRPFVKAQLHGQKSCRTETGLVFGGGNGELNKTLFAEVKSRIKDLETVTSLPSYLQENRGFKSQELNEQAAYEMPDDICEKPARHWMINDLVLFIG